MFKSFCDVCRNECKAEGNGTRRFTFADRDVGFECIPLVGGNISQSNHVCDQCLGDLFVEAFNKLPAAEGVKKFKKAAAKVNELDQLQASLEKKLREADKREADAIAEIETSKTIVTANNKQLEDAKTTIAVLQTQLQTLTIKLQQKKKIEEAQSEQLEIDKRENPDYIARVEKRERARIS